MNDFPADFEPLVRAFLEGEKGTADLLRTRNDDRGGIVQLALKTGTVIVKIWKLRGLKERLKSILHLSNGRREWRMHRIIFKAGIEVPEPLAFERLALQTGQVCEIMAMQDLGEVQCGLPYLKQLIKAGDTTGITALEDRLVQITEALIKCRVLDVDHQLNNFIVDARGRLMRIDFECASRHIFRITSKSEFGEMLARLIASHIYAVQPEVHRSIRFSEHLFQSLAVSRPIKAFVSASVNAKLAKQGDHKGVATRVALPV
jgi:hypothetical protein